MTCMRWQGRLHHLLTLQNLMEARGRLFLQIADFAEKVLGLRVAARTEHADQALGGAPVAAPGFSKPTVALM